eukprot:scaffold25306_cov63-Phaeocystis_antarctica.AAC.3
MGAEMEQAQDGRAAGRQDGRMAGRQGGRAVGSCTTWTPSQQALRRQHTRDACERLHRKAWKDSQTHPNKQ